MRTAGSEQSPKQQQQCLRDIIMIAPPAHVSEGLAEEEDDKDDDVAIKNVCGMTVGRGEGGGGREKRDRAIVSYS